MPPAFAALGLGPSKIPRSRKNGALREWSNVVSKMQTTAAKMAALPASIRLSRRTLKSEITALAPRHLQESS